MDKVIYELQNIDWNLVSPKAYNTTPFTEDETQSLEVIARESSNHVESRLSQLAVISKLMQISAQDAVHGNIGGFDVHDSITLGFFFEEELSALGVVKQLGEDADFLLGEAKKQLGGES